MQVHLRAPLHDRAWRVGGNSLCECQKPQAGQTKESQPPKNHPTSLPEKVPQAVNQPRLLTPTPLLLITRQSHVCHKHTAHNRRTHAHAHAEFPIHSKITWSRLVRWDRLGQALARASPARALCHTTSGASSTPRRGGVCAKGGSAVVTLEPCHTPSARPRPCR